MSELPKSVSDAFNEYYANAHGIPEHGPAYNFALTQVRWLWNFLSAKTPEFVFDNLSVSSAIASIGSTDKMLIILTALNSLRDHIELDAVRIAAVELKYAEKTRELESIWLDYCLEQKDKLSRTIKIEPSDVQGLIISLKEEIAHLRVAIEHEWVEQRITAKRKADSIRDKRQSPNSGDTLPKVGECTCATTKTTCPTHLTPYPEER